MDTRSVSREVDQNYDFFQRNLASFLNEQFGRFALIRHREIVGFYDDPGAAARDAAERFGDGLFSIQEVTDEPTDLGLYSNAANWLAS